MQTLYQLSYTPSVACGQLSTGLAARTWSALRGRENMGAPQVGKDKVTACVPTLQPTRRSWLVPPTVHSYVLPAIIPFWSPRMRYHHLLVTSLLFIGGLTAADPVQQAPVHDKPWKETFGMTLKGKDRTYVVYQDNSYLLAQPEDLSDPAFLHNKDVVVAAKLGR